MGWSGGGRCARHPAGQPGQHCTPHLTIAHGIVRNRRLPFCAAHCHRQPGGSGSFVGPRRRGLGETINCRREQIGEDDLQQARGAGFNRLWPEPEMQTLCGDRNPRHKITSGVFN